MNVDIVHEGLKKWIQENPLSYDVSDIKTKKLFRWFYALNQKSKYAKYFCAPAIILAERYTDTVRKTICAKKKLYPQGQAIIARAYLCEYKQCGEDGLLNEAEKLLNWLEENPSKGYKYLCWGQPFTWMSRVKFPKNVPRATVTSQVANAFIDAYEITGKQKYLDVAIQACNFFIEELNYEEDENGFICFSYTTVDDFNIHNASMLAAAAIMRTWKISKVEKYRVYAEKAMNFTLKYQNEDGSWNYWAPPFKIGGKIDNYHTGFVLEAIENIRQCIGAEFKAEEALNKGLEFYIEHLFDERMVPKMTNKSKYPIDIQSAAQSIITLSVFEKRMPYIKEKLELLIDWTIKNMLDSHGFFYYRIYKNNKIDKTPYIRWSESWMLRALALYKSLLVKKD